MGTSAGAVRLVGKSADTCPGAAYTTIADAVKAANAGDEIDICPALYPEQLVITKPVTLRGIQVKGIGRVLIRPVLTTLAGVPFQAVISVINTSGVRLENLAIDAGQNTAHGCSPGLAGIHFYNASGHVITSAVSGAILTDPTSCADIAPASGNAIQVDTDGKQTGFQVELTENSIHDFTRNGIFVAGRGVTANVDRNSISGRGPASGGFQFGIFIYNGAVAQVTRNLITQGPCGALSYGDCLDLRSEGVVLRAFGDGTVVDGNIISTVQSGIFVNGGNKLVISNNVIQNVDALSGMDIQGTATGYFTNSLIIGNTIVHPGPLDDNASENEERCGISEYSGTGVANNTITGNTVIDAYCGIAHVTGERLGPNIYRDVLYTSLNADDYPNVYPPPVEPAATVGGNALVRRMKRVGVE